MMKKILLLITLMFSFSLAQEIRVDGSSTVYPVTLAVAEEFAIEFPDVNISVAFSGTGGGFKKFCAGETQVSNASRPIKKSEVEECAKNGIEFIEIPVAADALTVVVNPQNDWISCITAEDLHKIWGPEGRYNFWTDIDASYPLEKIVLYGAGTDSGTFDYFTEAINGEVGAIRTDFFPSEDDNVLVQGVENEKYAMGFFGYAYYIADADRLKALEIDGGAGCVAPSAEAIENNTYTPLSRPMFIYINNADIDTYPGLADFVEFYVSKDARSLIADTGYAAYGDDIYQAALERFKSRRVGTSFAEFKPGDNVLDTVKAAE